jgi:hypothetical protein
MERFRRFNGLLQERYVRQLTHIAHPYASLRVLAGSGRVLGEQSYSIKGRGKLMTSDVAIDLGLDLVLVEVTMKRVTQRSLVDGDIEAVIADIRAMVIKKMRQLGRVVDDLATGHAELPGVAFEFVERIWPVVVVPDGLFQTPTLWAWLDENSDECLKRQAPPIMRPLVLLEAEEHEVLMGLVAEGMSLVSILELKTSPLWRERDFKSMHLEQFGDEHGHLPFVGDAVRRGYRRMKPLVMPRDAGAAATIADLAA